MARAAAAIAKGINIATVLFEIAGPQISPASSAYLNLEVVRKDAAATGAQQSRKKYCLCQNETAMQHSVMPESCCHPGCNS